MCTRYVFTDPAEAIREWFETTGSLPSWPPNYNVAPTHIMPVIRPLDGGREIAMMEWGLIPFFSKDGKRSLPALYLGLATFTFQDGGHIHMITMTRPEDMGECMQVVAYKASGTH